MNQLQTKIVADEWTTASWDEYIKITEDPKIVKANCYFHNGKYKIEMPPLGHDHACDNTIMAFAINLFCTLKGIPIKGLTNCTYRQIGKEDCQPDLSYYFGYHAQVIPWGTRIVHLDQYPVPDLVIEIADSSLADYKGEKRLQYEDLKVVEYWIWDVKNIELIAFNITETGSGRITESQVLPGLKFSVLKEALRRSRYTDQSQVGAWLLSQFQG